MNRIRHWVIVLLLLSSGVSAQEYVVTPKGIRVRLESIHWGVPSPFPRSSKTPMQRLTFYFDEQGERVLHGLYALIYLTGEYKEFTTFNHGVKDGPFARWFDKGLKEVEGQYEDGNLEGTVTWYYKSGSIKERHHYVKGKLHGAFTAYFENGVKQEEGAIFNDRREGPFVGYHNNGSKAYQGTYVHGFLAGTITVFRETGAKLGEGNLNRGLIVGTWRCFDYRDERVTERKDCHQLYYQDCTCP